MKKILLISLYIICLSAYSQQKLSIEDCRKLALENNKSLKVAHKQLDAAKYDQKSAIANYTPNIYAEANSMLLNKSLDTKIDEAYLPNFKPNMATGAMEPDVVIKDGKPLVGADGNPVFNNYAFFPEKDLELKLNGATMASVILEQPIYMGGKIISGINMSNIAVDITKENIRLNESELLVMVDRAYYQFLSVKEKLKLAKEYHGMLLSLKKRVEDSYNVQMVNRNDLLKAQVALNTAKLKLQEAEHGIVLAKMNLCRIVNLEYNPNIMIQDSISDIDFSQQYFEHSLELRPEYKMLQKKVELYEEKVDLARGDFLPQLGIRASVGYYAGVEFNSKSLSGTTYNATVNLKIPIFHWFERFNKVDKAKIQKQIEEYRLEDKSELMKLEIAKSEFSLKDALTKYRLTKETLEQASENMRISENNYQLGKETISDMLKTKAEWQDIYSQLIDAKINAKLKRTDYLKSLGKLY
jgi:outer membrane protein TolC